MQGRNQQELNDLLSKCRFEYFVKEIDDSNLQTIKLSYNNKLDGTTYMVGSCWDLTVGLASTIT